MYLPISGKIMAKNIFVPALDEFNLKLLKGIHGADDFRFHGLLDFDDLVFARKYPIRQLLARAEKQMRDFDGSVDGLSRSLGLSVLHHGAGPAPQARSAGAFP
jgi:hypothetical protein